LDSRVTALEKALVERTGLLDDWEARAEETEKHLKAVQDMNEMLLQLAKMYREIHEGALPGLVLGEDGTAALTLATPQHAQAVKDWSIDGRGV
jgi:hypothetical protein